MAIHVIADLHLAASQSALTDGFIRYLHALPTECQALYILGDLFEYWVGDDDDDEFIRQIARSIAKLQQRGIAVYFQHGNRDFLLGQDFAARSGMHILPDPFLLEINGVSWLLMHGDSLCTADKDYMQFRQQVRNPQWQREFLAKPLPERHAIAAQLRQQSKTQSSNKPEDIMDVSHDEVLASLQQFETLNLIHGHTHRPAEHQYRLDDGREATRWVLGDWGEKGWQLVIDDQGARLQSFPL